MSHTARTSVLVPTYNRAVLLGETLDVLARSEVPPGIEWEVVVIDNNSADQTAAVVRERQPRYPVPLRYIHETRQGRSAALNAAIGATTTEFLLFTDDDVRVAREWVALGVQALAAGWDYAGGPVVPIWEAPPPAWLDLSRSDLWGTIAILDYGPEPFAFEHRRRVPLGANLAIRRSLIERIGAFRSELGRDGGGRLLGQEVPELLSRARAAGLRGQYVPAMSVEHHVPARRLTRQYYRRWWMGKGYSRAVFDALQPVTEMGIDLRLVRHVGSLPRFMLSDAVRDAFAYVGARLRRDPAEAMRRQMRLAYLAGFIQARGLWRRPHYAETTSTSANTDLAHA